MLILVLLKVNPNCHDSESKYLSDSKWKPYLQAGLEAIKRTSEQDTSNGDAISAALCAIKSGQKLTFNPAQDNCTVVGVTMVLLPKMEDELVPEEQFHKSPHQFNQEGNCELADSLLEQQIDDLENIY